MRGWIAADACSGTDKDRCDVSRVIVDVERVHVGFQRDCKRQSGSGEGHDDGEDDEKAHDGTRR